MRFLRLHVKVKADGKWQKENEAAEVEDVGDIGKIKESLNSMEYDFLRENIHLGRHVMLVGLAEFEQYTDSRTDTVIYGFSKIVRLLLECNPNTMELLGLRPEQVQGLYLNIRYEAGMLRCVTGTALNFFTMDKSLETEWDGYVRRFFREHGIPCREE